VQANTDETDEGRVKRRPRNVYALADSPGAGESAAIHKQLKDMRDVLAQATQGIAAMAVTARDDQAAPTVAAPSPDPVPDAVAAPAVPNSKWSTSAGQSGRGGTGRGRGGARRSRDKDPCRLCGQLGHWANECRQRTIQPVARKVRTPLVPLTYIYVRAKFRHRPIPCLLDSGCERSVVGRRYVQGLRLKPTHYNLSVANRDALPLDGDVELRFTIDDHEMTANVSVSPAIDELLLGSDWLVENRCRCDFAAGAVYIGDRLIRTYPRKHTDICRRIVVSEECVVPPRHEANIPARMMHDSTVNSTSDWLVEPREIRPGVVAARTLVGGVSADVMARVCNCLDTPHVFREDSLLGLAEPVSFDPPGGLRLERSTGLRLSTVSMDRTSFEAAGTSSAVSHEKSVAGSRKKCRPHRDRHASHGEHWAHWRWV